MKTHVALVIKNSNNEILFVQRSLMKKTLPGLWAFPSGTIEKGEDVFQTAEREAEEELGIKIIPIEKFAEVDLKEFSVKLIFVLAKIVSGNPFVKEPEEIERFEWMTFENFFTTFSDEQIGHGLVWLRKRKTLLP